MKQEQRDNKLQPPSSRLPAIYYGGDYNPEQWMPQAGDDGSIWQEDMRLMRQAHINIVTIGVFSWVSLQPDEQTFSFGWLDRIMELLAENQIAVCLATATAAQPAWLSQNYPDVLPVDELGLRRGHGNRQNYCPTSPDFRRLARNLVQRLAQRYGRHPALALWHVSNEYGPGCYCERCAARFRSWLQDRYGGLEAVNCHWNTTFWSHTYTNWEQIIPPGPQTEASLQGLFLDYRRFISDMNLECYRNEADLLHELTPAIPVTTNFMGWYKSLDYFSWGPYLDIVSWDSYPSRNTPPAHVAFWHDLMRGVKGGQPWLLMEQTPSQATWQTHNSLKRPGVMRLLSYQAIAHGSDAVMYFQWRQSRGAAEMFHGAIIGHAGHENTRVFREVTTLGAELCELSAIQGSRFTPRVALLFSWPNWWNIEYLPGPSRTLNYLDELHGYYQPLWERNIAVDVISPDHDLSGYDLVIAPLLNMVTQAQAASIEQFVERGGTFVTSYFSGIVDEHALAWPGGYPGPLRRTLGIWVEEFDPLAPEEPNSVIVPADSTLATGDYPCTHWCDLLHLEGAQTLAHFGQDFYAGRPAITEHAFGRGRACYVATSPAPALLANLLAQILDDLAITAPLTVPAGVEVTSRQSTTGETLFVLNHNDSPVTIPLPTPMRNLLTGAEYVDELRLSEKGVAILTV